MMMNKKRSAEENLIKTNDLEKKQELGETGSQIFHNKQRAARTIGQTCTSSKSLKYKNRSLLNI